MATFIKLAHIAYFIFSLLKWTIVFFIFYRFHKAKAKLFQVHLGTFLLYITQCSFDFMESFNRPFDIRFSDQHHLYLAF